MKYHTKERRKEKQKALLNIWNSCTRSLLFLVKLDITEGCKPYFRLVCFISPLATSVVWFFQMFFPSSAKKRHCQVRELARQSLCKSFAALGQRRMEQEGFRAPTQPTGVGHLQKAAHQGKYHILMSWFLSSFPEWVYHGLKNLYQSQFIHMR